MAAETSFDLIVIGGGPNRPVLQAVEQIVAHRGRLHEGRGRHIGHTPPSDRFRELDDAAARHLELAG